MFQTGKAGYIGAQTMLERRDETTERDVNLLVLYEIVYSELQLRRSLLYWGLSRKHAKCRPSIRARYDAHDAAFPCRNYLPRQ